jgi:uncharacterized 2Fe-2S/4Fe-4S cluster protein (DUF4445 family)
MHKIRITLLPDHITLEQEPGTAVKDTLFQHGVEFPCGGRGKCRGCLVKVLKGAWQPNAVEQDRLSAAELAQGWRMACQGRAEEDLTLQVEQWEMTVLSGEESFQFVPAEGYGVAVDVGTTTLAAQLIDLQTGHVLATQSGMNPQGEYGSDLISRIQTALMDEGLERLSFCIRKSVFQLINNLLQDRITPADLHSVTLVGNSVMHHLFCNISPAPLAGYPFELLDGRLKRFSPADLGWDFGENILIEFLPCIGGFVGSDLLAGILSTGLHLNPCLTALIDLGTNGEIIVGNRDKILAASTAAGPAFEGGEIHMGMRATRGAISEVLVSGDKFRVGVIGGQPARGICGSGLVDAVAAGLQLGIIDSSGRYTDGRREWLLQKPVVLTQRDVRKLQLAKGAIAGGLEILLHILGKTLDDLETVYLAGAFGNYMNMESARRIGLLKVPSEKILPKGNTALHGARMALFLSRESREMEDILSRIQHISLSEHPLFQELYVENMTLSAN